MILLIISQYIVYAYWYRVKNNFKFLNFYFHKENSNALPNKGKDNELEMTSPFW